MALITLTEYKTYAGISGSGNDTALQVLIDAAIDAIERFCGRDAGGFESGTKTEYYDGNASEYLMLKSWPVTAVTSVKTLSSDSLTLTTMDSTSYRIHNSRNLVRTGVRRGRFVYEDFAVGEIPDLLPAFDVQPQFQEGLGNVQVVYTGGFTTVPSSLKLACYRLADMMWSNRRRDPAFQSESIGTYSYTLGATGFASGTAGLGGVMLPPEVAFYLQPFGRVLP